MSEVRTIREQILAYMGETGRTTHGVSHEQDQFSPGAVQQYLYSDRNATVGLVDALLQTLGLVLVPADELRALRTIAKNARKVEDARKKTT